MAAKKKTEPVRRPARRKVAPPAAAGLGGIAAALGTALGRTEHKLASLLQDLKRTKDDAQLKRAAAGSKLKEAAVALGRTLGRAEKELAKAQGEFKRALAEARK